jgi:predicted GH43/DUF377 family glycosyl hydrolase
MTRIIHCRHEIHLEPDASRVVIRPFIPSDPRRIVSIIARALALTQEEVGTEMDFLRAEFDARHLDMDSILESNFALVKNHIFSDRELPRIRRLHIGALFSGEYSLESTALFNPSIVPHPDQSNVPVGCLRVILSLRAIGEGHISSIEFRAGLIDEDGDVSLDPASKFVTMPEVLPNPRYKKRRFLIKLHEMGVGNPHAEAVMDPLGADFTRSELNASVAAIRARTGFSTQDLSRTLDCVQWLADSNYEIRFDPELALSERVIFPVSPNETNGIEDARFVRFTDDDGSVTYFATYTAYNGRAILPQLIETQDFLDFRVVTLNGLAVQNKGMALFPRRIDGRYVMLSRQDDENLHLMFSDSPYHWSDPRVVIRPRECWESVKIGNCGSPIETAEGWLVITHGVGPMRKYCIGAVLLDLEDPSRVIGRLRHPLISPQPQEREGYVPNVVYSCGSLVHAGQLILPFALSDRASALASIHLGGLLDVLRNNGDHSDAISVHC